MKKIILILLILIIPVISFALDTILDSPLYLDNPAAIMRQDSFEVNLTNLVVDARMKFIDSEGNIVKEKQCIIEGTAAQNLLDSTITQGKVGDKYINVIKQAIQANCKNQWNISGSE